MASRTRKKTRHNEGRKPIYKEHRRHMLPYEAEAATAHEAALNATDWSALPAAVAIRDLTEADVDALWMRLRWPPDGHPTCPVCGGGDLYDVTIPGKPMRWRCKQDSADFSASGGTIFDSRKLPLRTILIALSLARYESGRLSLKDMAAALGVDYKTAFALIRKAQEAQSRGLLQTSAWRGYTTSAHARRLTYTSLVARRRADIVVPRSFSNLTASPRYPGGAFYNSRAWWSGQDKADLKTLADAGAGIEAAAVALGRTEKSIAWYAKDVLPHGLIPPQWKTLITPARKPALIRSPEGLLSFPYVAKARAGNTDLLRANALVPKGLPESMRADVVQEMMLALYEGAVTMEQLERNRDRVRWFIAKFYKEQQPREEVSLGGRLDDDRSTDEIAAAMWHEHRRDELNDARSTLDSMMAFTPPTQLDEMWDQELSATHSYMINGGSYVTRNEAAEEMLRDDFKWSSGTNPLFEDAGRHSRMRFEQRYGTSLNYRELIAIRDFCERSRPLQVQASGDEIHRVRFAGQIVECVFCRKQRFIRTFLPPGSTNKDGTLTEAYREFARYSGPEARIGRFNAAERSA